MDDGKIRCEWCLGDETYTAYHDDEWGMPCFDDRKLFEMLMLEQAQAGLSWITILRKRENYRAAYDGFDPEIIANYGPAKIEELLQNPGIVRNRLKVAASIKAARIFLDVAREHGSFSNYIWSFTDGKPVVGHYQSLKELPASASLAEAVSRDLKKRGIGFFGPVIAYSFLQSVGVVDDHVDHCFRKNNR